MNISKHPKIRPVEALQIGDKVVVLRNLGKPDTAYEGLTVVYKEGKSWDLAKIAAVDLSDTRMPYRVNFLPNDGKWFAEWVSKDCLYFSTEVMKEVGDQFPELLV